MGYGAIRWCRVRQDNVGLDGPVALGKLRKAGNGKGGLRVWFGPVYKFRRKRMFAQLIVTGGIMFCIAWLWWHLSIKHYFLEKQEEVEIPEHLMTLEQLKSELELKREVLEARTLTADVVTQLNDINEELAKVEKQLNASEGNDQE